MASEPIRSTAVVAAPKSYSIPNAQQIRLLAVTANFVDNGAAGDWLPAVVILDNDGNALCRAVAQGVKITAGSDAEVSWFPWGSDIAVTATPAGTTFQAVAAGAAPWPGTGTYTSRADASMTATAWTLGVDPGEPTTTKGWGAYFDGTQYLIGTEDSILHSTDGVFWTATASPFNTGVNFSAVNDFVYAPDKALYVAGGANTNGPNATVIATSADGTTWGNISTPFDDGEVFGVTYGNGVFVACGFDALNAFSFMTSSDGATWTAQHSGFDGLEANNAIWSAADSVFVACGQGNNVAVVTSASGATWTQVLPNPPAAIGYGGGDIAYSPDLGLYCYASAFTFGTHSIWTTPDLVNWTNQAGSAALDSQGCAGIVWSHALQLFLVANNGSGIATSPDGVTWTQQPNPCSFLAQDVAVSG